MASSSHHLDPDNRTVKTVRLNIQTLLKKIMVFHFANSFTFIQEKLKREYLWNTIINKIDFSWKKTENINNFTFWKKRNILFTREQEITEDLMKKI